MAEAIGWGALPIGISLRGLQAEVDKKLRKPLEKASREAAEAASKNLTKAAEKTAKAVEDAKAREVKATEAVAKAEERLAQKRTAQETRLKAIESAEKKLRSAQEQRYQKVSKAESDYNDLRKSGKATTEELKLAEAKLAQARLDADARVIDRENQLQNARQRASSAASQTAAAESALAEAKKKAADASDAVVSKTKQHEKAQGELNSRAKEGTWLLDKLGVELADVDDAMERAATSTKGFAGHLWDSTKRLGGMAAGLAGIAGVAGTMQKGFAKVTSIEDTTQSLGILMGDIDNANSLMQDLQATNKGTPYAFDAWAGAGKKLVAFGVEAEEVSRTVTALGEAASASGKGEDALNSMSEAFGQAAAAGKLSMDTLNRLSDGGVQGLKILANEAGVSTAEMQKQISAGNVSAVEGIKILTDGILEGSEGVNGAVESMSGVMGEMAETTSGRLTNMQAAFNNLAAEIFKQINPLINDVAKRVTDWTYSFIDVMTGTLIPGIQKIIDLIKSNSGLIAGIAASIGVLVGGLKLMAFHQSVAAAGGFIAYLKEFDKFTRLAAKAQAVLNFVMSKNPAAIVIKTLALVTAALAVFFTKTDAGRELWAKFTAALSEKWDEVSGKLIAGFEAVKTVFTDVFNILFKGDFTGESSLFGLSDESSAAVDFLFRVRDAALAAWEFIGKLGDAARGIFDILVKGDFTGVSDLFGLGDESSATVNFLFTLRDMALSTGESLRSAFGSVKEIFGDLASSLGGALWDVLKGIFNLLQDLWEVLAPKLLPILGTVAKVIGGVLVAGIFVAVKAMQVLAKVLSGLLSAFSWLVENALAPFILMVGKVVGVILSNLVPVISTLAGIVTTVLAGAFKALGAVISFAWNNVIKPVFEAFATVGKWLFQVITVAVLTPILVAWNLLSEGIQWAWGNRIKPAFEFFADLGKWLWENALSPIFDKIKVGFDILASFIKSLVEGTIRAAFDFFVWLAQGAWDGLMIVFDGIKWGFEKLGDGLAWVNENIVQPVWDKMAAGASWLYHEVALPIFAWIAEKFQQMGDLMSIVKGWIVDKVFGGLGSALDTLQGWFDVAVDGIGRIWAGIKEKTAKPIQFVVDVVYNKGIRKAWNAVASLTGLDKLEPIKVADLGNYARGGVLPGYTPGRDPYTFIEPRTGMRIGLSGGEAVLRPEATRALGPEWVDNVNRAARSGGEHAVAKTLRQSHFASGGVIDLGNFANGGFTNLAGALSAVQQSMGAFVGRFFPGAFNLTSATRPGDPGYHGAGLATDWQAKDGHFQTQMPTPYSKALARAIYHNFRNSTELIHWPLDGWVNLKDGQHLDYGPATNAGHQNHVHWAIKTPLRFDGEDIVLDDVAGISGDTFSWNPISMVKRMWDGIIDKIGTFADAAQHGMWGQIPGAMAKKLIDSAWEFVSSKANKGGADDTGAYYGDVGAGVEQWRPMVEAVLRDKGFPETLADTVLRRMNQESNGNPRAINNWDINAKNGTPSKGLMQVIDPTFAAHKDPGYDDVWDPEANLRASMNYAVSRYGSLPAAYNRPGGYANGGVLPGFTPGVDVHRFVSPTGGSLALSGGEAIMVPEWTRAVGGPAAVERMNRAARAGRNATPTVAGNAFADGGTFWGPIGSRQRSAVGAAVAAIERLTKQLIETGNAEDFGAQLTAAVEPIRREVALIANPSTVEGTAARAAAAQGSEIAGLLEFKELQSSITALLEAEKSLSDARDGHKQRLADIKSREEELVELREQLAKLESGEVEEDVKDKRKIADAEKALAKARAEAGKSAEKSAEKVAEASEAAEKSSEKQSKSAEKSAAAADKAAKKVEKAQEKASESAEKSADKVAAAEEKLKRAREDVEAKAEEREKKRVEDIEKTNEKIAQSEAELLKARLESARSLDMKVFEVNPAVFDGLMSASKAVTASIPGVVQSLSSIPGAGALAAQALPQVASGLAGLAGLAGPAGLSVGVVIEALKSAIGLFKQIGQAIGEFIGRLFDARVKVYGAMSAMYESVGKLSQLTQDLRSDVIGLMADYSMALIKMADAQRNQRVVAMRGIQAQLQGQLKLAEAEDALAESRKADAGAAKKDYTDLSLAWGGLRHDSKAGHSETMGYINDIVSGNADAAESNKYVSDETLANEAKVAAAKIDTQIIAMQAAKDNLEAQWQATEAALDLGDVTMNLEQATKRLALLSGQAGADAGSSMVKKQISDLLAERAELKGQKGKNWWRVFSWHASGANKEADARIRQIDKQVADLQKMPEFDGFSKQEQAQIDTAMRKAQKMAALGGSEHIEMMLKTSPLGDAQRELDKFQLKSDLLDLQEKREQLKAKQERNAAQKEHLEDSGNLGLEIQGLEMMRDSFLTMAEAYGAKKGSNARSSLERLARSQMVHGSEVRNLAAAPDKVVQMSSEKRAYTSEEVEAMLGELDVRVEKLEKPQPSAALVAASRR